jgi:electron transfer flavoprotein beta subunit
LKIAVLVKASVDPNMLRPKPDGSVDVDAAKLAISEYDKNAVEAALQIREKLGGSVVVFSALTWGPVAKRQRELEQVVREALAMGADEAHLVVDEALIPGEPYLTARALAALIQKVGGFDLILTGEASMDMLSSQVGAMVAELLGIPFISFARHMEVSDGKLVVKRDLEDKVEVVEAPLPAIVSVTGEINQPRIPTLLQIRRAMKKPINVHKLSDLGVTLERRSSLEDVRMITVKRKNIIIEGENLEEVAEKLIEKLKEEGVFS